MSQIQAKKIGAKQIAAYVLLPGIIPRAKKLFASGFGMLAFLMAEIYAMVRLLPRDHPYLQPENIGKYGLRHVIAVAANHLVIKKENIDQIIVFLALMAGTVLLIAQFVILLGSFILGPASAQIAGVSASTPSAVNSTTTLKTANGYFQTANPDFDIAFRLMDKVFGVPNLFNSCVSTSVLCPGELVNPNFPYPFHLALHDMFQFYSMGLLIIAVLIFLYFVVVVIAETATTGTPFGQRFQNVWVPIRLVMAIGLLLPINYGYNSGQYITFAAAKLGSGFATNAWHAFNRTIREHRVFEGSDNANPLGEKDSLVGLPADPDASSLVEFMTLIHSCAYAYDAVLTAEKRNNIIDPDDDDAPLYAIVKPYFSKNPLPHYKNQDDTKSIGKRTTYLEALDFYNNSDIIIVFGERKYSAQEKKFVVEPLCGEVRIPVTDLSNKGEGPETGGPDYMLMRYFETIKHMWFDDMGLRDFAARFMEITMDPKPGLGSSPGYFPDGDKSCRVACGYPDDEIASCRQPTTPDTMLAECERPETGLPKDKWRQKKIDEYAVILKTDMRTAWSKFAEKGVDVKIKDEVLALGWGGAGVWYNKIADMSGAFVSSVLSIPEIMTYPKVMVEVAQFNRRTAQESGGLNQYAISTKNVTKIDSGAQGLKIAKALNEVYKYWTFGQRNESGEIKIDDKNIIMQAMNLLLGTSGIFEIRDEAAHIHPLAQLTTIGKGLVESAIRNIMGASASAFAGGAITAMNAQSGIGKLANAMQQFLESVAFIGLVAGVLLFYILPFLPFLYSFFAVGEWVKAIFEAMVGIPLWALAHLRLDGEGLPGEAAKDGYFLILEIALRPIFTVIALVAATIIFTAQVRVLNAIWDMVVQTSAGYTPNPTVSLGIGSPIKRNIVDTFFYTLIYTIVVYMMATAAFKLINEIPDNLLRWIGASVSAFGDINNQDPLEGLNRYVAMGGITVGRQAVTAATQVSSGLGQAVGRLGAGAGGGKLREMRNSLLGKGN